MAQGAHTTIEMLAQRLLRRWVPKWHEAFYDPATGGFHERLGHSFKPVPVGHRRLLTQCRQLSIYSHAGLKADLKTPFEYIVKSFHVPGAGWRFSVDEQGKPLDNSYDLYAHAFVIFALAHYYAATKDERAKNLARETLSFIDKNFRVPGSPGFAEALDENLRPLKKKRRHESHMHLLEACLAWDEPAFRAMADEMVGLFYDYFWKDGVLGEYYEDDLTSAKDTICEPGHYCEWLWLLKKHDPARHGGVCQVLLGWANQYGWDGHYGGIYDELRPDGRIIADTKRLWPFTEALKANVLMLDSGMDKDALKARLADMVRVFRDGYMQERGFWTESLSRDLKPVTEFMPGTTPYHVYFGIMETRAAMNARGRIMSWAAGPRAFVYGLRRGLSGTLRKLKKA